MKRIIFVVARNQQKLVPQLEADCRGGNVEIIVDRRIEQRRRAFTLAAASERRQSDRRVRPVSSDLHLIGIAVVVVPS